MLEELLQEHNRLVLAIVEAREIGMPDYILNLLQFEMLSIERELTPLLEDVYV